LARIDGNGFATWQRDNSKYGFDAVAKKSFSGHGLDEEVQGCIKRLRNDTIAGSRRANCGAP
jgi:hypothetical protein